MPGNLLLCCLCGFNCVDYVVVVVLSMLYQLRRSCCFDCVVNVVSLASVMLLRVYIIGFKFFYCLCLFVHVKSKVEGLGFRVEGLELRV